MPETIEWEPFDQGARLPAPPWDPADPALIAWEDAHGHDARMKCYPEFGCLVIEASLEREVARLRVERDQLRQRIDEVTDHRRTADDEAARIVGNAEAFGWVDHRYAEQLHREILALVAMVTEHPSEPTISEPTISEPTISEPHWLSGRPWSCFVKNGDTVVAVCWGLTARAASRRARRKLAERMAADDGFDGPMTQRRDEIGLTRLLIGLAVAGFWGGALALADVRLTWQLVLWVAVPTALWVTWPVTVRQWRRQWRRLREPGSKQGPESKNRD